jgi:hypothetical protein
MLKVLENPSSGTPTAARNRLCTFLLALGFDTPSGRPELKQIEQWGEPLGTYARLYLQMAPR